MFYLTEFSRILYKYLNIWIMSPLILRLLRVDNPKIERRSLILKLWILGMSLLRYSILKFIFSGVIDQLEIVNNSSSLSGI
ncbi:hypothetical protein BpHYR1_004949 [Brachionus plicatilis]|uniref:Uncharacterized protein n=1 Tax=Brachionus plicatilis TaxID=10195 RepID=A0A3M7QBV6_BRAPC|nr:hypothetical protein BpHYR1_004949 [Brachionus plicatilis]